MFLVNGFPVQTLFIMLSIPLVLSIPITDSKLGDASFPGFSSLASYQNMGTNQNIKLIAATKTRKARQGNYPLMIYGGCYPTFQGAAGRGWGWGSPSYPPYNSFGNQNRAPPFPNPAVFLGSFACYRNPHDPRCSQRPSGHG
ncbi:uncharacterized protein LOC110849997 isoform X1 [Folsomia candida]|uniref:uncharacterized protein LOC110849939 isoform X1 n=1 Tax=Folsomia candida TaxID=158441 RepID=UPI000B8FE2FF|nr:uncharacterized protein LOC110849939 isoform X1 [Folsomia candida]XP_021953174.1 uncharacterized protein LOC110849997 isoform X1 [Folsomia candida]